MNCKTLAISTLSLLTCTAGATTLDYRHEFRDTSMGDHRDRFLVANRFDNGFGFALEARWGQHSKDRTENHAFRETVSLGTEFVASYLQKYDGGKTLEGGFSLDSGANYSNYRPYIRGGIKPFTDLGVTLRFRPYYKRNSNNIGTTSDTKETGYNLTTVATYSFNSQYSVEYELDYQKATSSDVHFYGGQNTEFTQNLKLAYAWDKNWKPYVEFGNVSESGDTYGKQTRFRAGIQYNF